MTFSKIRLGKEEIFETTVKDVDGRVLENWRVMKKDYPAMIRIFNDKYGLGIELKIKEKDRDLDWALK